MAGGIDARRSHYVEIMYLAVHRTPSAHKRKFFANDKPAASVNVFPCGRDARWPRYVRRNPVYRYCTSRYDAKWPHWLTTTGLIKEWKIFRRVAISSSAEQDGRTDHLDRAKMCIFGVFFLDINPHHIHHTKLIGFDV